jgi:hypothetical protein
MPDLQQTVQHVVAEGLQRREDTSTLPAGVGGQGQVSVASRHVGQHATRAVGVEVAGSQAAHQQSVHSIL